MVTCRPFSLPEGITLELDPLWRRICGVHLQSEGHIGAVWLAHDREADVVHLYDAAIFQREVLAVIAEGLVARARWVPVAWPKEAKDLADKLLSRGVNMLPEHSTDSEGVAEVISRDISERMRTDRFKVERRLQNWLDEYRNFYREDGQVPRMSHPLMSATRYAISQLDFARR